MNTYYFLITENSFLRKIAKINCNTLEYANCQKKSIAKIYNIDEKNILVMDEEPTISNIKKFKLKLEKGFTIKDNQVKEMTLQEKVDAGILRLEPRQAIVNGGIYTYTEEEAILKGLIKCPDDKIIDGDFVREKTYKEKYQDKLISKEEYNENVNIEREREYKNTTDKEYNILCLQYDLKEITEKEFKEGLEKIKEKKKEIKKQYKKL